MYKLVIIGAGGLAREVAWLVEDINARRQEWNLLGYIDENTELYGKEVNGLPVLGDFDYFQQQGQVGVVYAVCAVGNPRAKMNLVRKAGEWNYRFVNLIHPTAHISKFVSMGKGNIICANSIISTNVSIGSHVCINPGCGIGHDAVIEDYTTILWNVNLSGRVKVEEGCELGTKTVAIQSTTIGRWSVTGAGAVIIKDIPPHCTAVGVPAVPVKLHGHNA